MVRYEKAKEVGVVLLTMFIAGLLAIAALKGCEHQLADDEDPLKGMHF